MSDKNNIEDYNTEPVTYCARCYSLKIKHEDVLDADYCGECGSTDTAEASIEEWEQLFERRYGHKYAEKSIDPKKSYIYNLPIDKLKKRVYDSPYWKDIIKSIFPRFPKGYSKVDSIILFFDSVFKHNRLEDLRLLLFNYYKY